MNRTPADSGLSLVELVVSVAIVGIMLALGFSASGLLNNRRLAAATRVLVSDIRDAQQRARADRHCWRIAFDRGAEHYQIEVLEGETAGPGAGCTPGPGARWREERTILLPRPIDLQSTTFAFDRLILSPFGGASAGAATLATPAGIDRAVVVGPQGSVTVGHP